MTTARITGLVVPKWGMTMQDGTLVAWLVEEGEEVHRGQDEIGRAHV